MLVEEPAPRRGRVGVGEALVEEPGAELDRLQAEAVEVGDEPFPLAGRVVVRERAEAWPGAGGMRAGKTLRAKLRSRATSGGRARRGLEGEPTVVADLGERPRALDEVDATAAGADVAGAEEHVLHMHASDERAERADLGRRIEAPPQRVCEVEVAAEGRRGDEGGKLADAIGGKQAFEAQAHAALGGGRAKRGECVCAAVEIIVRPELRLEEERGSG